VGWATTALCLTVAAPDVAWVAQPPAVSIVVVLGDQTPLIFSSDRAAPPTLTVIEAAKRLRLDPRLARVSLRIVASDPFTDARLAQVAAATVVIVPGLEPPSMERLGPAIASVVKRGGHAYLVTDGDDAGAGPPGLTRDPALTAYAIAGGVDNWEAMLRRAVERHIDPRLDVPDPITLPDSGYWNPRSGRVTASFEAFLADVTSQSTGDPMRPWVGLVVGRAEVRSAQSRLALTLIDALDRRGFNVATVFAPSIEDAVRGFVLEGRAGPSLEALVLLIKGDVNPDRVVPLLTSIDVPVLNALSLQSTNRDGWEASAAGLSLNDRHSLMFWSELAGAIAPTVVATRERQHDRLFDVDYRGDEPIAERITRLVDRVAKQIDLRRTPVARKRLALIYYNTPPGHGHVEAEYLNVFASLTRMFERLRIEGYQTGDVPEDPEELRRLVMAHGLNASRESRGALAQTATAGRAVLLPITRYRAWFDQQPKSLRDAMIKTWGQPEAALDMVWFDGQNRKSFVFPVMQFGNILLAPQPPSGWDLDTGKAYTDLRQPPHHQYLAFYLWLQREFRAQAVVNVGAHGTHESLPGKDAGFTAADPSEIIVGDIPQVYPFVVAHVGDALRARRRGMATIISHMMPPYQRAVLNSELTLLVELVSDYGVARQTSEIGAAGILAEMNRRASTLGVLKDIEMAQLEDGDDVATLGRYLLDLGQRAAPYGLHTFGVSPTPEMRRSTAEAIVDFAGPLSAVERARQQAGFETAIEASATAELDSFIAALSGRYVPAGVGGIPLRKPASLPTGRNIFGFDPTRVPTPAAWEQGRQLAERYVAEYLERHGRYPSRTVFVGLWDSIRADGVTHAEILALLGVKPRWDDRGTVIGVEVIDRATLGRPRVDVTVVPAGRSDGLLIKLVDDGVSAVKGLDEPDNPLPRHMSDAAKRLTAQGVDAELAARIAAVRVFTAPLGASGTGLDNVIPASNTWNTEARVADVYFNRMGALYGQGFWGDQPMADALGTTVFRMAFEGVESAFHTYSGDSVAVLDHTSAYRHLGGALLAARQVNQTTPEAIIVNLEGGKATHESLDRFMGRELRTRYTNPEWVKSMLDEGHSGGGFVNEVVQRLFGFQVTAPEAVDGAKWQEIYATYVADRNQLGVVDRFRQGGNLLAYQALVDRMIVAVNKGYWSADATTVAHLNAVNRAVIAEAGVGCEADSCSSPEVVAQAQAIDRSLLQAGVRRLHQQQGLSPSTSTSGSDRFADAVWQTTQTPTIPLSPLGRRLSGAALLVMLAWTAGVAYRMRRSVTARSQLSLAARSLIKPADEG